MSGDTSDDENIVSMFHQQSRNTDDTQNASEFPDRGSSHGDTNRSSGTKNRNSARHVSAEVHVVPFDDRNVDVHDNESSASLRVNQSIASSESSRSQINELSDTNQTKSQESHIVEIHADEESHSGEANRGKVIK